MASQSASEQRKTVVVKLEAELKPRPEDEILNSQQLQQLELFGLLKRKVSVEKFPGSIVLRRYRAGETICRQGERGHSAFYIARTRDLLALRKDQLQTDAGRRLWLENEIARLDTQLPSVDDQTAGQETSRACTAHIVGGAARPRTRGIMQRMADRLFGQVTPSTQRPRLIPNDGPSDIDYETRQAPMYEGEVFGEMSCMTLSPRSATVIADRECYLVEFLRNIFDQMQKDAGYRQQIDRVYEERVLEGHLQRLQLFRDLSSDQLRILRKGVRLEVVEAGTVICDEGDCSDDVYIIRSGMVQVVKGVDVTVGEDDIGDWPAFCQDLLPQPTTPSGQAAGAAGASAEEKERAARPGTPLARPHAPQHRQGQGDAARGAAQERPDLSLGQSLPQVIRTAPPPASGDPRAAVWAWLEPVVQHTVRQLAQGLAPRPDARSLIVRALNELIRCRAFVASQDLAATRQRKEVLDTIRAFPRGPHGAAKDWTELEVRVGGRLALEAIFAGSFPKRPASIGPPRILGYMSRGDCFGEMAMVLKSPRQATCMAYDHPTDDPNRKAGRVELVRIRSDVFAELLDACPQLRAPIDRLVAERQENIRRATEQRPWDDRNPLITSPEFRDAGLIQGQSLLLIDLDRCTRCGDCVRACVNTHDDGHTRLFLDGPRFDRFLVPSACRKCLNPACMIGCPVGSIQRGDNGQIEIRDWCIGCGLCARQCPYDSIQMHDMGVIPEVSQPWQFLPESAVTDDRWNRWPRSSLPWAVGTAPFQWNLDLHMTLGQRRRADQGSTVSGAELLEPICFRYQAICDRQLLLSHESFRLFVRCGGLGAQIWINGQAVKLVQDARQQKRGEYEGTLGTSLLRAGKNLVAVRVSPDSEQAARKLQYGQTVLSLRLDPVAEVGALTTATAGGSYQAEVELVTEKAVVCDLCSSLPSQRPACVDQCPHDAAIRVDARFEFPLG